MLPLVSYFDKFNDDEINAFATASIENDQIWNAGDCRYKYLPQFLKLHRSRVELNKCEALENKLMDKDIDLP